MRPLPTVTIGCALVMGLSAAAVVLGERDGTLVSFGAASPVAAVLELGALAALLAAAAMLSFEPRQAGLVGAVLALGVTWVAPIWAGWSDAPNTLRVVALVLVPALAPVALLVGASLVADRRLRVAAVSMAAVALTVAGLLWLVRDPFLDRYCWRDCLVDGWAPWADVDRARTLTNVTLTLATACGMTLAAVCAAELARSERARRNAAPALVAGAATGLVLAASSLALLLDPAEAPGASLHRSLFVARAVALIVLAAGLAVLALRPRTVRSALARLAGDPTRRTGDDLGTALGAALGEPELRLGYPLTEGGVVDASGRPLTLEPDAIRIERGGEVVALVGSAAGSAPTIESVDSVLGPAARLALANERLRAEQLVRLRELTDMRRRIVATGDATRRRLERDLHDGAQQRLLALQLDLRVAIGRAESGGVSDVARQLRAVFEEVSEATAELRVVAHGIFPAELTTSGLVAALESLADSRPLVLSAELDPARRFPAEVEAAAYTVLAEASASADTPVSAELTERSDGLVLELAPVDGWPAERLRRVEDVVGAAGGTVAYAGSRVIAAFPDVEAAH